MTQSLKQRGLKTPSANAGKTAEERHTMHLEPEKPVLEAFGAWLDSLHVLPKSKLGEAVTYALNLKPYLENYLRDGRCAISNNRVENAVRPFTVGRCNWLFANTPKGAKASSAIHSLVESTKANRLDVYKYFNYILTLILGMDWHNHPRLLEKLLPRSETQILLHKQHIPFNKVVFLQNEDNQVSNDYNYSDEHEVKNNADETMERLPYRSNHAH